LYEVYKWKCHKATVCVAILSKNVIFFSFSYIKSENRRAEQLLPGGVSTDGSREEVGKW
jgi:hypothetical protein